MTALYGRYYELTLYSSTGTQTLVVTAPVQIQFHVSYYPGAVKGTAEITLYGLNLASMDQIIAKYDRVKLVAGYYGSFGTLFDGKVFTPSKGKYGAEQFLLLYCSMLGKDESQANVNTTWGAGTRVCDIVNQIAGTLGTPYTMVPKIDDASNTFWADLGRVARLTITERSYRALDDLGRDHGFIVYRLVDRVLLIPGKKYSTGVSHEISSSNGMEGSPLFTTGPTVNVIKRLDPKIFPGDEIVVKSRYSMVSAQYANYSDQTQFTQTKSGRYYVASIIHIGDFNGDTWSTSIQGYSQGVSADPISSGDNNG